MEFGLAGASYGAQSIGQASNAGGSAGEGDLIGKLAGFDRKLSKWAEWRTEAREAREMVDGHQWPQDALDAIAEEEETASPATFNRIAPMVDAISGAEITNRQVVKYAPRQVGDVQANEILGGAADWARQECDAGDEESQAFRDGVEIGFGVTETRMDYIDDPEGMSKVDRVDPVADKVEVWPAAKPNFTDARVVKRTRRYEKLEACALFPALMGEGGLGEPGQTDLGPHLNNPETRYNPDRSEGGNGDPPLGEGEVEISEYQYRELERITLAVDPATGQILQLTQAQCEKLATGGINVQTMLQSASVMRWRWQRCFKAGARVQWSLLPDEEFTYKFITGKLDRKKGTPYGVVRAMIDPQRWTNKFYLQMDRIFGTNAKGGLLMEEDAVEDVGEFEDSYAAANKITWVANGAISGQKIHPKPAPPFPAIAHQLMQIAHNAVAEVTGVNKEMLGMAEREQAGVLEYQRKQAAFGVLAVFFDSLKRYRKLQGRLQLKYIRKYMSDGRLVRIVGGDGLEKYVPLIRDQNTARYDVIVDEAPAGPNQVERTWATFVQGAPMIKAMLEMGLPPQVIFTILKYSPFPSSFVSELRDQYMGAMQQTQQPDPMQQFMQQLQMANAQAQTQKLQGEAMRAQAQGQAAAVDAALAPQREQSEAMLRAAQAHAAWIESQLLPRTQQSEAELASARAASARVDAALEPQRLILDAQDQVMNWRQAQLAHAAKANALAFDGPGFGAPRR